MSDENERNVDVLQRNQEQPVAARTRRSSSTLSNTTPFSVKVETTDDSSIETEPSKDIVPQPPTLAASRISRRESPNRRLIIPTKKVQQRLLDNNKAASGHSNEIIAIIDEMAKILKKNVDTRSEGELKMLEDYSYLVPKAEARLRAKLAKSILKQRAIEQEESLESIEEKTGTLAQLIRQARYIVIYTGAGISTSASIPDYRGPNGLWTQIKKTGTFSITKIQDLSSAEPTLTHMAIKELCRRRIVNHVVSQNCDGLHLRSGIKQTQLSEIHGDMYIEVCPTCEKQYFRQADITERTSRFRHKTGRKCHTCAEPNNNLIDTIVLYGERSRTQWPMNWERASKAAKHADLIICMGSSLKTLRRYNCLWPKRITNSSSSTLGSNSRGEQETKLVIINLQYTSKDKNAVLKINGKCDLVMQSVMRKLNIDVPVYDWSQDPLQKIAIPFTPEERSNLKRNLIFETKPALAAAAKRQSSLMNPSSNQQDDNEILNYSMKRSANELSRSPSLFVSELTDDPEKKRLRMRIRAVNIPDQATSSGIANEAACPESMDIDTDGSTLQRKDISSNVMCDTSNAAAAEKEEAMGQVEAKRAVDFSGTIPGWLGKSLGSSRSSGYRRKRHGNKGRKHSSVLKPQQSKGETLDTASADATENGINDDDDDYLVAKEEAEPQVNEGGDDNDEMGQSQQNNHQSIRSKVRNAPSSITKSSAMIKTCEELILASENSSPPVSMSTLSGSCGIHLSGIIAAVAAESLKTIKQET